MDEENLLYIIFQKLHKFYGIKIGGGAIFDKSKENLGLIILKVEENKRINEFNGMAADICYKFYSF